MPTPPPAPEQTFYIRLPSELLNALHENEVDVVGRLNDLAEREGGQVRPAMPTDPTAPAGAKGDVALAILAIGVTSVLISIALSKIIDALGRNEKYLVTESELRPVLDSNGAPTFGPKGQPLLYWAEVTRLIEAKQVTAERSSTTLSVPRLLEFKTKGG